MVSTDFKLERQDNTHSTHSTHNENEDDNEDNDEVFDVTPKQGHMHLLKLSSFPPFVYLSASYVFLIISPTLNNLIYAFFLIIVFYSIILYFLLFLFLKAR